MRRGRKTADEVPEQELWRAAGSDAFRPVKNLQSRKRGMIEVSPAVSDLINDMCNQFDMTRTQFVEQAIRYAIAHMEPDSKESES